MLRRKSPKALLYIISATLLVLSLTAGCSSGDEPSGTLTPTQSATTAPAPPISASASEGIVRLPHDEGAHLSPVEWWYFNGHLDMEDGRTFSYHFVTFQSVLPSGLTPRLMQLSWSDHKRGIQLVEEKAAFPQIEKASGEFDLEAGGWRMSGDGKTFDLSFSIGEYAVELNGVSTKPPVLHYETGYVDLGIAGKTYYYSHTDVETSGSVSIDGSSTPVTGVAWMDHQWGDFTTAGIGWDWFSLNLEDGSDLKISVVWEIDGNKHVETYGTYVPGDGGPAMHLPGNAITLESTDYWTSPDTGGEYPLGWRLRIDSLDMDLTLNPVIKEAEYSQSAFVPVVYWEGAIEANGVRQGRPLSGRGFAELVGYVPNSLADLTPPTGETAPPAQPPDSNAPNKP